MGTGQGREYVVKIPMGGDPGAADDGRVAEFAVVLRGPEGPRLGFASVRYRMVPWAVSNLASRVVSTPIPSGESTLGVEMSRDP